MAVHRCIWCLETKPESAFNREHVIPEAFGKFENNLVLNRQRFWEVYERGMLNMEAGGPPLGHAIAIQVGSDGRQVSVSVSLFNRLNHVIGLSKDLGSEA